MAVRRKSKAGRRGRARQGLSEAIYISAKRFLVGRLTDLAGLTLMALAAAGIVALLTYSPTDPSFNHITSAPAKNALGTAGAHIADSLLQAFGAAAALAVIPWFAWGIWLGFLRGAAAFWQPLWARGTGWVYGLWAISLFAAALPTPFDWPVKGVGLGGAVGDTSLILSIRLLTALGLGSPFWLVGLFGFITGFIAIGFAVGLTKRDARQAALWTWTALVNAAEIAWSTARWGAEVAGNKLRDEDGVWRLPVPKMPTISLQKKPKESFEGPVTDGLDYEGDFVPEPILERTSADKPKRIERPQKPAKQSPREKAEAQTKLNLGDVDYELPELSLLTKPKSGTKAEDLTDDALEQNARMLEGVLQDFGVKGEIIHVRPGPVVTLYELEPAPGIKSSRVIGLADDIARSMSAVSARVAVVPGRNAIGIELPNRNREMVFLREIFAAESYEGASEKLPLALGKTIGGEPVVADLARMPHLLIAGTTGSGKSVAVNTMILSLLYRLSPAECKLIMIDPKMLELSVYDGIPHLLSPVVTDPKKAIVALKWVVREMEDRYRKMSKVGVRNISGYNTRMAEARESGEELKRQVQTGFDKETGEPIYEEEELSLGHMPFIVVIIDEMADLMMVAGKDIEAAVQRLAQMARAAGIHMIMATQRPSVDVITGTIKANFPTRISFQVTSKIDSRTILGEQGAEQLLGQGDMLYMAGGGRITRVHGPFVSDVEVEKIVNFLKAQGEPDYLDAITADEGDDDGGFSLWEAENSGDDLYDKAVAIVARDRKASTSYIQRKLQIGYNRAARLMEQMEDQGVVSPANHAGKREILVGDH